MSGARALCYNADMSQVANSSKRLVECKTGVVAGILLMCLWIASMSVVDVLAFTFMPVGFVMLIPLAMVLLAMVMGRKVVALPLSAWLSLGIGIYYLFCCTTSSGTVDAWSDMGLIYGAFVFYVAGIYAGQQAGNKGLLFALMLAVLVNGGALWLMDNTECSIHILGRAEETMCGANTRSTALFPYKNFSGLAFSLMGMLLICYAVWSWKNVGQGSLRKKNDTLALICLAVGVIGVVAACFCGTRVVWLVVPLMGAIGGALWILHSVYEDRRLGIIQMLFSVILMLAVLVFIVDSCTEHHMLDAVFNVDSHLRFLIWSEAWRYIPDAPLMGFGSGASQWVLSATYHEWNLPNYVHNEYLQMWLDYGFIGVSLMVGLLALHIVKGVCAVAAEKVDFNRRLKVSLALLCLVTFAAAALTDFVWHNFSFVCITAFACGILISPYPKAASRLFDFRNWAPNESRRLRPLRAQRGVLLWFLVLCGGILGYGIVAHCVRLLPGWRANMEYDSLVASGAGADELRGFLLAHVEDYPDSRVMDSYALAGAGLIDWSAYEKGLEFILQHNPRQLFMVTLLADVYGRQGKYEQAELLFRRYYPGDGLENTSNNSWAVFYATNLYAWAQDEFYKRNISKARSLYEHAQLVTKSGRRSQEIPSTAYRAGKVSWVRGGSKQRKLFLAECKRNLKDLRVCNVEPDDSWMSPMEPGGKPALYSRFLVRKKR